MQVVVNDEYCFSCFAKIPKQIDNDLLTDQIDADKRFIKEKNIGLLGKCPGNNYPLQLSPG
ncbi:hypothetical protein D3C86_2033820 [compost metagenome]